jgi:hypothetical protein
MITVQIIILLPKKDNIYLKQNGQLKKALNPIRAL